MGRKKIKVIYKVLGQKSTVKSTAKSTEQIKMGN